MDVAINAMMQISAHIFKDRIFVTPFRIEEVKLLYQENGKNLPTI